MPNRARVPLSPQPRHQFKRKGWRGHVWPTERLWGGSNNYQSRLWKPGLRLFADRNGIQVEVCHHTPGNSKSDKIERCLFSQISTQWRGQPPASLETVRSPMDSTTTKTGLAVRARIDRRVYERGAKVPDGVVNLLAIVRHPASVPAFRRPGQCAGP